VFFLCDMSQTLAKADPLCRPVKVAIAKITPGSANERTGGATAAPRRLAQAEVDPSHPIQKTVAPTLTCFIEPS